MITYADIEAVPAALEAATRVVEGMAIPDWDACATAMQAVVITSPMRGCFNLETAEAVDSVGPRRRAIMEAMSTDVDGRQILAILNSRDGVKWAHPRTRAMFDQLIALGIATQADKDVLVELSAPTSRPYANVTAEDCINAAIDEDRKKVRARKQGYLSEANDACFHIIDQNPAVSQADVLAAFTSRLEEVWV